MRAFQLSNLILQIKDMKQQSVPKRDRDQKLTLYDNLINDVEERQLQKNLANFIESRKLYDEILAKGKQKIDEQFHERKKKLDASKRIYKSSLINKHHMMKNQLRMCEQVFTCVLHRVKQMIEQDQDEYCLILIKLIVEGALRMFEPELHIRCLPAHLKFVEKILRDCEETFDEIMKQETGRNYLLSLKINKGDYLTPRELHQKATHQQLAKKQEDHECIGGIILSDVTGNITYKNTIDTRINILREISLPAMRTSLWPSYKEAGKN